MDEAFPPSEAAPRTDGGTVVFAYASDAAESWQAAGFAVITQSDLITSEITEEAKRVSERILRDVWQTPVAGSPLGKRFVYRGIDLVEVAHAHLSTSLVDALVRVAALDERLRKHGAREVWVPQKGGEWSRAAVLVARAHGLPVRRLRKTSGRVPLWPPRRRSFTQWLPDSLRRWRERREARAALARFAALPGEHDATRAPRAEILGVAHYVGGSRALAPVFRRMMTDREHTVALVADEWGRAGEIFDDKKLPFHTFQSLGPWKQAVRRINAALPAFGKLWMRALTSRQFRHIQYRGVSITALMREQWRALGDVSLRQDCFRQYLLWIEVIERAFRYWSPRLVMFGGEAMPFGTIVVQMAEMLGIRTLCVIHGAILDHPKHRASRATKTAVSGDASRRFLLSRGTDEGRIVVTGLPQLDTIADHDALARVPVRQQLSLPDGMPVIVYTMLSGAGVTPPADVLAATHEVLVAAECLRGSCVFVFKRHPADRTNAILSQFSVDWKTRGIVTTADAPLHPLLWNADLVITQMSTTGQEAIMLEKPLIVVNVTGKPDTIPYVAYGAALGVYRSGQLADAIGRALHDDDTRSLLAKGRREFIADFAYRVDGKATDRVLHEIDRLLTTE